MNVTQCLRDEHIVILAVLDCFERALGEARQSHALDGDRFRSFLHFFRDFADTCHHQKEESELFPFLEKNGIPRHGGPLGVMLQEHEQGRSYLRTLAGSLPAAAGGDAAALGTVLDAGVAFALMLREHIEKENECLFEMAEDAIQGEDVPALLERYAETEANADYRERFTRCRRLADELCDAYGRDRVGVARVA